MTGKTVQTSSAPREPRTRRAAAPRPEAAALVQGLERLRDSLIRRLEQIETLALEQATLLEQDSTEREQVLRERVFSLEAAQARLQAEGKRREQEWQTVIEQLEADRKLLADAWERLEQQQIAAPQPQAQAQRASAAERPAAVAATTPYRPIAADEPDDPVTRTILRQFQALKSDVRRNAKGRNGR